MANIIKIDVDNPDELLNAAAYGAGAVIRVERSLTGGSGYAEVGTTAIVAGTALYTYYDPSGTTGNWYRTRYSNAGNTSQSDYGAEFQASVLPSGYCSLDDVKDRLNIDDTDVADDEILLDYIDTVAGMIESITGRDLRPVAPFPTTVAVDWAAGSSSGDLTSAAGLKVGDVLMFGPVSGTHESAEIAAISGVTVTLQTPLAATYVATTVVTTVRLFDGYDAIGGGYLLPVANGIVSLSSVEVALTTGGSFALIPGSDWFLRPTSLNREPGWPATELWMTNIPSAGNTTPYFPPGYANIRLAGTFGWPSIPREIADLSARLVVTAWRRRSSPSSGDTFTIGIDGQRTFENMLAYEDRRLLVRYSAKEALII